MDEKFTPGPWFYAKDLITIWSKEGDVCDLITSQNEKQMPFEANGALISSAPELYNTLKNILNVLNGEFFPVDFSEDGKVLAIDSEFLEAILKGEELVKTIVEETNEKFTPGPWLYEKDLATIFSEEGAVCDLVTNYNGKQMSVEANRSLISSAPELYNTLKDINKALNKESFPVDFIEDGKILAINAELYEAMIRAFKVLKKARGEA